MRTFLTFLIVVAAAFLVRFILARWFGLPTTNLEFGVLCSMAAMTYLAQRVLGYV